MYIYTGFINICNVLFFINMPHRKQLLRNNKASPISKPTRSFPTMERHATSRRDVADAVRSLT